MEFDTGKMNRLAEFIKTNPDLLQQVRSASDSQAALTLFADASRKNGIDINVADLTALINQAGTPKQGALTIEQLGLINAGSEFDEYFKSLAQAVAGAFLKSPVDLVSGLLGTHKAGVNIAIDADNESKS
jgi:hypothetical protein